MIGLAVVSFPSRGTASLVLGFCWVLDSLDPSGIVTFVHLLDLGKAVEDELMEDCFGRI